MSTLILNNSMVEIGVYIIYFAVLLYTVIRILLDTDSTPKTLAYILLVIVLPVLGVFFYFSFGINFRHRETTRKRMESERNVKKEMKKIVPDHTEDIVVSNHGNVKYYDNLIRFIHQLGGENLTQNDLKLLLNGEEKFPEVLRSLEKAEHHIHLEYYAWENDVRGNEIKEVLKRKMKEGVAVRILYDAYASRKIKRNIVKELKIAGAEIYPIIEIKLKAFANRMNHRDHRKIVIIDGHTGFVGGINISDRYDNSIDTGLYWRDTHVKIVGGAAQNMQRHFLVNWNASQDNILPVNQVLFPNIPKVQITEKSEFVQLVAGGPIYDQPNIMLAYNKIFSSARKKLYITNPYFIPNESILTVLKQAAISGVDVRLMVPKISDSGVVGAASKFYFDQLLESGVRIFLYSKGFVHAKTLVMDGNLSVVGTANMDIRSFDLNFEIMSVIYGADFALQLENAFMEDLKLCDEVNINEWMKEATWKRLIYAIARLVSSFL